MLSHALSLTVGVFRSSSDGGSLSLVYVIFHHASYTRPRLWLDR